MTPTTRRFLTAAAAFLVIGLSGGLIAYLAYQRATGVPPGVPAEVRYVPADAALVAYADVRRLMSSDLRRELMPTIETRSQKGRQMMNDFAGIDLEKQVDHVVGYVLRDKQGAAGRQGTDDVRAAMFVRGSFDEQRVEQSIRDHGGTIEDYRGRHISIRRHDDDEIAVGFVQSGLLAVGAADLVRRAMDIPQAGLTDLTSNQELMALIQDASGSTAWVAGHFDAVTRGMKLPGPVSGQMPSVRLVSAKANVNGGVKATIRAETADRAAAQELADVVRAFLTVARLHAGDKAELAATLKSVQLSNTDKSVQLMFAVTPETLRLLVPAPHQIEPPARPQQ